MKRISQFILLLFFIPVFARAQNTPQAVLDSIAIVDSTVTDIEYDDEEEEDNSVTQAKQAGVFLPRDMIADDSLQLRHVREATVRSQQQDEAFWYANHPFKKEAPKVKAEQNSGREPLIFHPAFETVMWIVVIAGFLTFLVLFLRNGNAGIFRRSKTIRDPESAETDFDDIFAINYQQQIDKAAAEGNYNFGVRLLYLRLLRSLAERNIIDYKQDRTNFDYLMQLQQTKYYKDFFRLTRHYEYSWYGQFSLEQEKFNTIRQQFENFDRNLN